MLLGKMCDYCGDYETVIAHFGPDLSYNLLNDISNAFELIDVDEDGLGKKR